MHMNKNTKTGYYTLEAAIILPMFVIAVITFGYLIKMIGTDEQVMHAMTDEGRRLSMYSYSMETVPVFPVRVVLRVDKTAEDAEKIFMTDFEYLFSSDGIEDLIYMEMSYAVDVKLPLRFYEGFDRKRSLLLRAFTGSEHVNDAGGFENMQRDQEYEEVWIFPVAGKKYHNKECDYIDVCPRRVKLTHVLRLRYSPCKLCEPGKLANGTSVYCFESGRVYHRGNCHTVDRYVVSMDRGDAEKKGYTACSKCRG